MNPSIYEVRQNCSAEIVRVCEQSKNPQQNLELLTAMFEAGHKIFASFFRPGETWEDEVFVCPLCAHATREEYAKNEENEYYCKYCYTSFTHTLDRGFVPDVRTNDEIDADED